MKTEFKDGLWTRTTHFKHCPITITCWRERHGWVVEAECQYGKITKCGSNTIILDHAKSALKILRMNIPLWSHPEYGLN